MDSSESFPRVASCYKQGHTFHVVNANRGTITEHLTAGMDASHYRSRCNHPSGT